MTSVYAVQYPQYPLHVCAEFELLNATGRLWVLNIVVPDQKCGTMLDQLTVS